MNRIRFAAITVALLPAASLPQAAQRSCTEQMRARPYAGQAEAKRFAASCLAAQGAAPRTLTRADVLRLISLMITADHPLAKSHPADAATFCPAYPQLAASDRAAVWRALLAAMARPESNYRTAEAYWEVDQRQYSLGLLQLSLADERGYRCGLTSEVDLTDPDRNLGCAVRIMARLVAKDGRIGGDRQHRVLGGARYWSTLRVRDQAPPGAPSTSARDEVISATRSIATCRPGSRSPR